MSKDYKLLMPKDKASIIEKIKEDIENRGLNQSQYADLFEVHRSIVTRWLKGELRPSRHVLMLMRLSTDTLIKLKDKKTK